MSLAEEIIKNYMTTQRDLIEVEAVDDRSIIISMPLHFSAFTPVELSVTQITDDQFILSDMAQTLGELKEVGYAVGPKTKQRILSITKLWHLELSGNNLTRICSKRDLGSALHEFAEAAKTIGDVYLSYSSRIVPPQENEEVKDRIRETLHSRHFLYKEKQRIPGKIEAHKVDFFVPPNGLPGLAIAILLGPDKIHAEAWGFKARDIKDGGKVVVGIVYDPSVTKQSIRNIIDNTADIPLPSDELASFGQRLDDAGLRSVVQ